MWATCSKVEAGERELAGMGLNRLNDWRIPVYVNRKQSGIFTGTSSYTILIKNKKQHSLIVHNKIYNMHLEKVNLNPT